MSMTAVQTKVTPTPAPNPPTSSTRPSNAIQKGADLLLNLVEEEREKMTRLYHDDQKTQESRFMDLRTKNEAALAAAETKIGLQQTLIEDLALQAQKWKSQRAQLEAGSSKELQELRSENERLKASLAGVGLEYLDGSLRFDEPTARVVEDFVQGARVQDTQVAILLGSEAPVRLIQEEHLSKPVGPTEFFGVLAGVLEKGRRFAAELEKRTKAGENGGLKSKVIPIANAVTTQPPESQTQDLEVQEAPLRPETQRHATVTERTATLVLDDPMRVDIVDGPEPRVSMDPSSNEDLMEDVTDSESRDEEYLKVLMGNRDVVGHADEQASDISKTEETHILDEPSPPMIPIESVPGSATPSPDEEKQANYLSRVISAVPFPSQSVSGSATPSPDEEALTYFSRIISAGQFPSQLISVGHRLSTDTPNPPDFITVKQKPQTSAAPIVCFKDVPPFDGSPANDGPTGSKRPSPFSTPSTPPAKVQKTT